MSRSPPVPDPPSQEFQAKPSAGRTIEDHFGLNHHFVAATAVGAPDNCLRQVSKLARKRKIAGFAPCQRLWAAKAARHSRQGADRISERLYFRRKFQCTRPYLVSSPTTQRRNAGADSVIKPWVAAVYPMMERMKPATEPCRSAIVPRKTGPLGGSGFGANSSGDSIANVPSRDTPSTASFARTRPTPTCRTSRYCRHVSRTTTFPCSTR